MKVPLSTPTITEDMKKSVAGVLDSRRFVKGPKVKEFEEKFSRYCGVKHGVGVNSGTSAIYIALRALNIGKGDKVLTPSHSFVASATPILFAGAEPVFVDVGDDYLMSIDDLEEKITEKTKAVICVHLYGQMCDMKRLIELKEKHGFYLVEDACQAHGAEFGGKKSGTFGDISCFSFFPSKNLTVCGDGGMSITNNEEFDAIMKALRDHGRDYRTKEGKFKSTFLGLNMRMSEISGVLGIEQLKYVDEWIDKRRNIAKIYDKLLTDKVTKPINHENGKHVYHLYVIITERRDELKEFLSKNEIETGIHYPLPIHKQPIFSNEWNLPKTEKMCGEILSLPIYPTMKKDEVEFVCEKINEFFK